MQFEEGWLERQLEAASNEVKSWPEWKRKLLEITTGEPMSDREYKMRNEDSKKYGNY